MTPEEKAIYLMTIFQNKKLACICCDEALNVFTEMYEAIARKQIIQGNIQQTPTYQYWTEVKFIIQQI